MRLPVKIIVIVLLLFTACGTPDLGNFDARSWKEDTGGCQGRRTEAGNILEENKDELLGLGVKDIRKLLGQPDRHELQQRNSRRFVYFTAPGAHCDSENFDDSVPHVTIRIGPLGEVTEITFYE